MGKPKQQAWKDLSQDKRVVELLTAAEKGQPNKIIVEEGAVNVTESEQLLDPLSRKLPVKLQRSKKKWAKSFRAKINEYVYRKGDGKESQTWPLIRKVTLSGPWHVLSSGACLVDLPGVRDANAARAGVAEHYLQHCHYIWIMAPIKRAVDDGTAKELLGEQFKRRLLMDGQYCNVRFICTQSDDCELSEVMADHEDVARTVEGRWETMNELKDQITNIENESPDSSEMEDLRVNLDTAKHDAKKMKAQIQELEGAEDDEEDDGSDDVKKRQSIQDLEKAFQKKKQHIAAIKSKLKSLRQRFSQESEKLQQKSQKLQKKLKSIAAVVRNEYSTRCIQDDFIAGLEEMTGERREGRETNGTETVEGANEETSSPLPNDFKFQVNCVSANDYLKIQHIKPTSDGPPNTFDNVEDTQIPSLRDAVHDTTAEYKRVFAQNFISKASNLLDRVNVMVTEDPGEVKTAKKIQAAFETEMKSLDSKIGPFVEQFVSRAQEKINIVLQPPMKAGAAKSTSTARTIASSWGSKPDTNGLRYPTYNAVLRRFG